jgi:hypothetical protein
MLDSGLNLYQNERFKDFTIYYKDFPFPAHKCILSSTSNYFDRMLCGEWNEKNSCTIQPLDHVTPGEFQEFIRYLYTSSSKALTDQGWVIYELCDYFNVLPSIKQSVLDYLLDTIAIENASKFIPIINQMMVLNESFDRVQHTFLQFVVNHSQELAQIDFPFQELEPSLLKNIFLLTHVQRSGFQEGSRVEGNYRGKGKWYPGTIRYAGSNNIYDIHYDDGETERVVPRERVRLLVSEQSINNNNCGSPPPLRVFDRVEANYRSRGAWFPGRIRQVRGYDCYDIDYDDGETEIRVKGRNIRRIPVANLSTSSPSRETTEIETGTEVQFHVGSRVEGNYLSRGTYYPGMICRLRLNGTFDIDYDDGEQETQVREENLRLPQTI